MQKSNIEWTNQTWNPVTGCTKISAGCKNCYAANIAETRFGGQAAFPDGFNLIIHPERLTQVTPSQQPKNIFVNSMSDMFHERIPVEFLRRVCDVMMSAPQHRYQILTKRHERMKKILSSGDFEDVAQAKHIWWGVSVEDCKYGLPRIKTLVDTPVRNRFVSFEPLLEDLGEITLCGLDWIIIGGESGPGARPFALEWAESLIRQARRDQIAVFMKQIGAKPTLGANRFPKAQRDPKGHQLAVWPEHLRIREFPRGIYDQVAPVVRRHDLIQISPAHHAEGDQPAMAATADLRPSGERHVAAVKAWETRRTNIEELSATAIPVADVPILGIQQTREWLQEYAADQSDPLRASLALSALVTIQALIPGSALCKAEGYS